MKEKYERIDMIKIRDYITALMVDYIEYGTLAVIVMMSAYQINIVFGNVVYVLVAGFVIILTLRTWHQIFNPVNWYKNCWHNGGK